MDSKAKIKTRKGGAIIGQMFVKGRQLKGSTDVEFYDAATAAEIDATDTLNKERIPRIYRKGIKNYFDRLGDSTRPATADKDSEDSKGSKEAGGEEEESDPDPPEADAPDEPKGP